MHAAVYPQRIDREERKLGAAGDPVDEPPHRLEAALWLIGLGAVVALLGALALPASEPRSEIPDVAGPTLLADGPGYWVAVGAIVLALVTVEAVVRRNRAWLAIVALGAAATTVALLPALTGVDPLPAPAPYPGPRLLAHPGPGLWTLALAGPLVAAGGLLLRGTRSPARGPVSSSSRMRPPG